MKNVIFLRKLETRDATQEYADWLNDPDVNQYLETRFKKHSISDIAEFINNINSSKSDFLFGIFLKNKPSEHLGNIKIGDIKFFHLTGVISLVIGKKEYWGQGIASKAISLISEFAQNELKLVKLTAGAYSNNIGSIKAFKRNGFKIEGNAESQWIVGKDRVSEVYLGKILKKNKC